MITSYEYISKTIEYHIAIRDLRKGAEIDLKCSTLEALQDGYAKYNKDPDYEVLSAYSLLTELKDINLETVDTTNTKDDFFNFSSSTARVDEKSYNKGVDALADLIKKKKYDYIQKFVDFDDFITEMSKQLKGR